MTTLTFPAAIAAATMVFAPVPPQAPRAEVVHFGEIKGESATLTFRPLVAASNHILKIGGFAGTHESSTSTLGVEFLETVAALRQLHDGWMGQSSLAPSRVAIDELVAAQSAVASDARISPAADGSIVIEWERGDREFLVSIERDNTIVFVEEDDEGTLIRERHVPYAPSELQQVLRSGSEL